MCDWYAFLKNTVKLSDEEGDVKENYQTESVCGHSDPADFFCIH